MQNLYTREELIKQIKNYGQSIIDNADSILGDEQYFMRLNVSFDILRLKAQVPSIEVKREFTPEKDIFELEQIYNIMIHDMADQLTTDYYGQSWIINYYFQKAKQKLKGGKPVMKVMISQPMNGRRNDDIKKEREEIIKKFNELHIDVIDSIIEETADPDTYNEYHPSLFYIAKSIEIMGKVDAVYFMKGWEDARGCRIERNICHEYGVKILDENFFKQPARTVTINSKDYDFGITTTRLD